MKLVSITIDKYNPKEHNAHIRVSYKLDSGKPLKLLFQFNCCSEALRHLNIASEVLAKTNEVIIRLMRELQLSQVQLERTSNEAYWQAGATVFPIRFRACNKVVSEIIVAY